jgi:murein DD-endopeptidase MepM/ murein hydrolase activator NlpD
MSSSTSTQSTPWYSYPVTHGYITTYQGVGSDTPHYAEDFGAPQDTPFFFLEPGTIQKADYQAWGGEVFLKPDSGGPQEYVYHLDEIDVSQGQHVDAGQLIGLSGGQTSGGSHPTDPRYSTGPHIHFGEFTEYTNSPDGEIPYGPNPGPLVAQAQDKGIVLLGGGTGQGNGSVDSSGGTTKAPTPLGTQVNAILSEFPGFAGIALALDKAEQFPGVIWYNPGESVTWNPTTWPAIFDPSNYIGPAIRSVLDTIWSNTVPLLVRGFIVFIGLILVIGLIRNAINATGIPETMGQIRGIAAA